MKPIANVAMYLTAPTPVPDSLVWLTANIDGLRAQYQAEEEKMRALLVKLGAS